MNEIPTQPEGAQNVQEAIALLSFGDMEGVTSFLRTNPYLVNEFCLAVNDSLDKEHPNSKMEFPLKMAEIIEELIK